MAEPIPMLEVNGLHGPSWASWRDVRFKLSRGDVVLLRGESGAGKTTLLRCLADLVPEAFGEIKLQGHPASSVPAPNYRARVFYCPQRPAVLPGSPRDFFDQVSNFAANRNLDPPPEIAAVTSAPTDIDVESEASAALASSTSGQGWTMTDATASMLHQDPATTTDTESIYSRDGKGGATTPTSSKSPILPDGPSLRRVISKSFSRAPMIPTDPTFLTSSEWGLPSSVWDREWSQISGGEAQRVALAIAITLVGGRRKGEGVLLLDEPTSALDTRTTKAIEKTLLTCRRALTLCWITHSDEQAKRVLSLVEEDNHRRRSTPAKYDDELLRDRKVYVLSLDATQLPTVAAPVGAPI